eukprot:7976568-Pyramimonas_sp.AAC.1
MPVGRLRRRRVPDHNLSVSGCTATRTDLALKKAGAGRSIAYRGIPHRYNTMPLASAGRSGAQEGHRRKLWEPPVGDLSRPLGGPRRSPTQAVGTSSR